MAGRYHKNKEINAVITAALSMGWRWKESKGKGHTKGTLYCPFSDRAGCWIGVNSTPRQPETHAKQVLDYVTSCKHGLPKTSTLKKGSGSFRADLLKGASGTKRH